MADLDDEAGTLLEQQSQLSEQFAELAASVEDYAERLNLDPEQMRQVEERYNLVQTLKRKYGGSLQEVITFGEKAAKRLADLEGRDEALAKLNSQLGELDETIQALGQALGWFHLVPPTGY